MKREEIAIIAQLLTAIKDAIESLEIALKKKDQERVTTAKLEILGFQKKIEELL